MNFDPKTSHRFAVVMWHGYLRPAWPLWLVLAVCIGLAFGGTPVRLDLRYDRLAVAAGQWWRLFTGNYVHLGWTHVLLDAAGLSRRAGDLPGQLSGGERQRVAIGRALMNEPGLVLFDEPTSALDSHLGDQVVRLIRDEMRSRGTAAVIVTHDDRITHYADRTGRIEDGRIGDGRIRDEGGVGDEGEGHQTARSG